MTDKEQYLTERKILKSFVSVAPADNLCELWQQGTFELLLFIQKFKLESSVPNTIFFAFF